MSKIFVSYRRKDTPIATDVVCRAMVEHFGADSVFFDVDTIPKGVDFRTHLRDSVNQCDILLVMIGDRWLDARAEDGTRRLDEPTDFVRIEVEAALGRGIPVLPVLVGDVVMPREIDLPVTLKDLPYRNAAEVRTGGDFRNHVDRLVRDVAKTLDSKPSVESTRPVEQSSPSLSTPSSQQSHRTAPAKPKQSEAQPTNRIAVQCPNGHRLTVNESSQGKRVKCPTCSTQFIVPNEGEETRRTAPVASVAVSDSQQLITNSIGMEFRKS
jgi:hypothetical protein